MGRDQRQCEDAGWWRRLQGLRDGGDRSGRRGCRDFATRLRDRGRKAKFIAVIVRRGLAVIVRRGLAMIVRDRGFPCAAWTRGHGASGTGSHGKAD